MDHEHKNQISDLLSRAKGLTVAVGEDNDRVGALVTEIARSLLTRAHQLESSAELQARATLAQVLSSARNQAFSVALTDRIHRSSDPKLVVSTVQDLVSRVDPSMDMPFWDRLQLAALARLGQWLPDLTRHALLRRVDHEARPFLFHAGEPSLSREIADRQREMGAVNLNYLGEEVLSERDASERRDMYHKLAKRDDIDALSLKISGIDAQLDPLCIDANVERLWGHLEVILSATRSNPKPPIIYFDMEAYRDLEMAEKLLERLAEADVVAHGWAHALQFGLAVQAYLPEALGLIERLAQTSHRRVQRGLLPLRLRLVKGANLLTERVEASQRGLTSPIFPSKLETDSHYKRCLRRLIEHAQSGSVAVGVASHNLFDISYALVLREHFDVHDRVQIEMLEGMAGATGRAVAEASGPLLVYAPAVSDDHFTSAVSYLVRRLDENTVEGHFLRDAAQMEVGDAAFERQQRAFLTSLEESWITPPRTLRTQDRHNPALGRFKRRHEFNNAPDTDWSRTANRKWLQEHETKALEEVHVRPILHESIAPHGYIETHGFDPSVPSFQYPVELATASHIQAAIAAAHDHRVSWAETSRAERIALLRTVAERLEHKRGALLAAMVLDAGKRAVEADIEISEAVDFARFYAHSAESDPIVGAPRGVAVIAPPWNFPLAIPLGGVLAALVTGNTVLLKPAPETPWVAWLAVQICHEAGIPRGALQLVPCRDEDATALIVDPRVEVVVLTGATSTAQLFLNQRSDLLLMAETGGKNAAYVSSMSDREQAIAHILQSAFGHAGQKCSALSVLILQREVFHDVRFRDQLVDAAETLVVGSARDPRSFVTPLIRPPTGPLESIITDGERYGTWALRPKVSGDNPRLLSPGILWGVEVGSFPQQTEFFGPILSVVCAEDFDDGMRILNSTVYGLTAGLYSLLEAEQEKFVALADAGNLYINRPITGAVVGRQPFGGRKKSGFGPGAKAGGRDYLRQFAHPPRLEHRTESAWGQVKLDYQTAMRNDFSAVHQGTPVLGEHNYLRYQTARTMLVIGADVDESSLAASLLARSLADNRHCICVCTDADAETELLFFQAQRLAGVRLTEAPLLVSVERLAELVRQHQIDRLRVLGRVPPLLLDEAASLAVTVLRDPVSSSGKYELFHYLTSQSVSHSYHRHGNLKLGQLSRILTTLERANRKFDVLP